MGISGNQNFGIPSKERGLIFCLMVIDKVDFKTQYSNTTKDVCRKGTTLT